jgi:hypothetical protein
MDMLREHIELLNMLLEQGHEHKKEHKNETER